MSIILFIKENAATIIVCCVLAFIIGVALIKLIRDKKSGKTCGCGCSDCPASRKCRK